MYSLIYEVLISRLIKLLQISWVTIQVLLEERVLAKETQHLLVLEELSVFLETSTLTSSISVNFNHLKEIKMMMNLKPRKLVLIL